MIGKCLWFDVRKGYGFLRSLEHDKDVFAHYSKIVAPEGEFRVLEEGDEVEFDLFFSDRQDHGSKPQAKNIRKVEKVK